MAQRKSTDQFIEDAKKLHGDQYNYSLVTYKTNNTKVEIICSIHGKFLITPVNHLQKIGCKSCSNELRTKDTEYFIECAQKIHNSRYDYSSVNYIKAQDKVKIICKDHGVFKQKPSSHTSGQGCPQCAKSYPKTYNDVVNQFTKKHGNTYNYTKAQYVNDNTKLEIICKNHGSFFQTPNNHKRGTRCPTCSHQRSHGEETIYSFLLKNQYDFIEQYVLELSAADKRNTLKYDFYVPKFNLLIEFDGEQHYKFIPFIHKDVKGLDKQKKRDLYKNKLAKKYNKTLLRISYENINNIDNILQETFYERT